MRHLLTNRKNELTNGFIKKFEYAIQYSRSDRRINAVFNIKENFKYVDKRKTKRNDSEEVLVMNGLICPKEIYDEASDNCWIFSHLWGFYLYATYEDLMEECFCLFLKDANNNKRIEEKLNEGD